MAESCECNLILGDMNSHFSRQTQFTSIIEDFFDELDFVIFWDNPDVTGGHSIQAVDYTFLQNTVDGCYKSTIDHFVSNSVCFNSVVEAGVIHLGDNPSNHSPIYAKLDLGNFNANVEVMQQHAMVNWGNPLKKHMKIIRLVSKKNLKKYLFVMPYNVVIFTVHPITNRLRTTLWT